MRLSVAGCQSAAAGKRQRAFESDSVGFDGARVQRLNGSFERRDHLSRSGVARDADVFVARNGDVAHHAESAAAQRRGDAARRRSGVAREVHGATAADDFRRSHNGRCRAAAGHGQRAFERDTVSRGGSRHFKLLDGSFERRDHLSRSGVARDADAGMAFQRAASPDAEHTAAERRAQRAGRGSAVAGDVQRVRGAFGVDVIKGRQPAAAGRGEIQFSAQGARNQSRQRRNVLQPERERREGGRSAGNGVIAGDGKGLAGHAFVHVAGNVERAAAGGEVDNAELDRKRFVVVDRLGRRRQRRGGQQQRGGQRLGGQPAAVTRDFLFSVLFHANLLEWDGLCRRGF